MGDTRTIHELKPHPLNDEIYKDEANDELIDSIADKGILTPLLIAYDNRIISGHRRYSAAHSLGLAELPVVVFGSTDELDIEEALIDANKQRQKTGEQIGREYKHLKRILNERESRQGKNIMFNTSVSDDTEVVDIKPPTHRAAEKIGVGKATANKAERVVDYIDYLQERDEKQKAEQVRQKLNHSVNGAYTQFRSEFQQPKPKPQPRQAEYITLDQWNSGERWQGEPAKTSMNTVNENIEWAAFSWNPVTGCLHNCAYCYARDIANRFFDQKFAPSFIPERLSQPANTRQIQPRWYGDTGHNNVFTCSMADLFGKWVPTEWIEAVLQTIERNPQWNFLLLSKFPIRMAEFNYPPNVWLGTSVDYQWAVERAEKAFRKVKASGFEGVCWLSCEPMMERLTFGSLDMFDWVVMGGSSRSTQTPEYRPPFDDIVHLYNQARASGCLVYQKTNLIPGMSDEQRIREYPK